MTIAEMHVWFRQYAQQMGMQNVRAILPEQIDIMINTSITDTVNQVIAQNTNMTSDRVITTNSKLGQINALRSLYKVKLVDTTINLDVWGPEPGRPFSKDAGYILRLYGNIENFNDTTTRYYGIIEKTVGSQTTYEAQRIAKSVYDASSDKLDPINDESLLPDYENEDNVGYVIQVNPPDSTLFDYLYLADLSINYVKGENITNYFPVRIIDDIHLADTLNDFALRPQVKDPIAVIYDDQLDLYIDKYDGNNLPQSLLTNKLRVGYIAKPAKVKYDSVTPASSVKCDLPEYMHVDILKHAVDLYRIAVNNGMYGNQQQQVQNPSTTRQVGTGGEGYQS